MPFICPLCVSHSRPTLIELEGHIKKRHVTGTRCELCQHDCKKNTRLIQHLASKKHYKCNKCSQSFMTPTELSKHAEPCRNGVSPIPVTFPGASRGTGFSSQTVPAPKVQAKVLPWRCSMCHKSFSSKVGRRCHIKVIHRPLPCASCNQTFRMKSELTAHTVAAHPADLFQPVLDNHVATVHGRAVCSGCDMGFISEEGLNQVAAYPAGPACSLCQFTCLSQPVLDNHVAAVHTRAVCSGCDVAFISEEGLYYHYLQSSKDAHPKCIECDLEFENDAAYATHHQTSHPELSRSVSPPAPYPCSLCDNDFNLRSALDDHMAATHPFTCGMCDFACPEEELIQEHFASAHSCPVCHEGVFANADLLNEHLVDHATPYHCDVCQTRYAEEEGLRQHYQDSPDDIHPSCTRCGLGFQDAGDYYDHTETIHPQVSCQLCDGALFDPGELPMHYLTSRNHPVCDICQVDFSDLVEFATRNGTSRGIML